MVFKAVHVTPNTICTVSTLDLVHCYLTDSSILP